jgi:Txe/YoeB family toxin of Txe-Axe toxin-antitoxin module
MSKEAMCPKTGKPHRWQYHPTKSIKYRIKNDHRIIYHIYECADCHIRMAPAHHNA